MPNQNLNISISNATVVTYRSNSVTSFFRSPDDATPQDCKEITSKLIEQARAILFSVMRSDRADRETSLQVQLEVIRELLMQANIAIELLDIGKAVTMAQRGEA